MRVIFTDLDGVLNPHWKTKWSKPAIKIYNQICKEYDLKPVITSTWRINHTKEQLQNIFNDQGIEVEIYDYTPHIDQKDRGLEIKEWLSNNKVDNFVIIDDIVHNIIPHVGNVVKVRSWIGLSKEEYIEIKKIFDEHTL
jgi:aspartate/tyrosine/aromatic aminotransferase